MFFEFSKIIIKNNFQKQEPSIALNCYVQTLRDVFSWIWIIKLRRSARSFHCMWVAARGIYTFGSTRNINDAFFYRQIRELLKRVHNGTIFFPMISLLPTQKWRKGKNIIHHIVVQFLFQACILCFSYCVYILYTPLLMELFICPLPIKKKCGSIKVTDLIFT